MSDPVGGGEHTVWKCCPMMQCTAVAHAVADAEADAVADAASSRPLNPVCITSPDHFRQSGARASSSVLGKPLN